MRTAIVFAVLMALAPLSAIAQTGADITAAPPGEEIIADAPAALPASPASPVATGFQVVRLGDSQLTCEQLLTEINGLSAEASAGMNIDYSAMMPSTGGLGMLSGLDPTGISSMIAGRAMATKAQADANKQMEKVEEQMAGFGDRMALAQQQQQRMQHLQSIFQTKQC